MATLNNDFTTLADAAKEMTDTGEMNHVIEQAFRSNPFVMNMLVIEGNRVEGHKHSVRTGLPSGTWRKLYQGVNPGKDTVLNMEDKTGELFSYNKIDESLIDSVGGQRFRARKDASHAAGMTNEVEDNFFYGDQSVNPERITGLAPRYSSLTGAINSTHVLNVGGSTAVEQTSMYLITWHEDATFAFFGKGRKGGLDVLDMGLRLTAGADGGGGEFNAWVTRFKWNIGVGVGDWRYTVRVCNIETGSRFSTASNADTREAVIRAKALIPNTRLPNARMAWYMNSNTKAHLDFIQTATSGEVTNNVRQGMAIRVGEFWGQELESLNGVPIIETDAIADNEAVVT